MHTSVLLTGALALLASASPLTSQKEYPCKECRHAVVDSYGAKRDCSANLAVTVTAAPRTQTITQTAIKSATTTVTSTVAVRTVVEWTTDYVSTTTVSSVLHVPTLVPKEKRTDKTNAARVPGYASKYCKDAKEYAAACALVGVKPFTTTVPGKTATTTTTVSKTKTATRVIPVTDTVTKTSTQTAVATVTEVIPQRSRLCHMLASLSRRDRVALRRSADGTIVAGFGSGETISLSDNDGSYGYLVFNAPAGNYFGYSYTSTTDPNVDVIAFSDKFKPTSLLCQMTGDLSISGSPFSCSSQVQQSSLRTSFFVCQWDSSAFPQIVLAASGFQSSFCESADFYGTDCNK